MVVSEISLSPQAQARELFLNRPAREQAPPHNPQAQAWALFLNRPAQAKERSHSLRALELVREAAAAERDQAQAGIFPHHPVQALEVLRNECNNQVTNSL